MIPGTEQPPNKHVSDDEEEKEDLDALLEREKLVEKKEENLIEEEKKEESAFTSEITNLNELAMINNSNVTSVQNVIQTMQD